MNAGEVNLTATLEELDSGSLISGATIYFYINPEFDEKDNHTIPPIGDATTNYNGVAILVFDVNVLGVGDHNLYAEYRGNIDYNPSNDSNTLGISYLFVGFRQPINQEGTSIFGNGRVIPIKIKIVDANNAPVPDAKPTVWLHQYSNYTGLGEELETPTSVSSADTDNIMRYVPTDDQYLYNYDLSSLSDGTYAVSVILGDSPTCTQNPHHAIITVEKKGKKK